MQATFYEVSHRRMCKLLNRGLVTKRNGYAFIRRDHLVYWRMPAGIIEE